MGSKSQGLIGEYPAASVSPQPSKSHFRPISLPQIAEFFLLLHRYKDATFGMARHNVQVGLYGVMMQLASAQSFVFCVLFRNVYPPEQNPNPPHPAEHCKEHCGCKSSQTIPGVQFFFELYLFLTLKPLKWFFFGGVFI